MDIATKTEYDKMFGNIETEAFAMARCACIACNSCMCACSCRIAPELDELGW